ncbi:hypothetical protein [Clostridium transplantifaecale]|uniref:hypothetical protein n=1 Tax=Clostridium transplantifaecale TaxID=2479838 RepID=UPI000F642A07|nr:hypothetical protein [Clostridium transplantifaecale]
MAVIFTYGLALAIGLVIGLVLMVIGLFFGNIILFDSISLAAGAGFACHLLAGVHPAICLVIGLVFLFWLQNTAVGFWIIGGILSLFWAFVFGFLAYAFSGEDMVWFYVVMGLGVLLMGGLHLKAKNS